MVFDFRADDSVALEVQRPWSTLLLSGTKTVETRGYALPDALLARPLTIVETEGVAGTSALPDAVLAGAKDAAVAGEVVFSSCFAYASRQAWLDDHSRHCVSPGGAYDWDGTAPLYGWVVGSASSWVDGSAAVPRMARRLRSLFEVLGEGDSGRRATLSYRGSTEAVALGGGATLEPLFDAARRLFALPAERDRLDPEAEAYTLKLLHMGKALRPQDAPTDALCRGKIMVVATAAEQRAGVEAAHADPGVPSFAAEHGSRRGLLPATKGARQGKM